MHINYVIATYAGKGTKLHIEPKEIALKIHCQRLTQFKNNLKSITIMRANDENSKNNSYEGYYEIEDYTKNITPTPRIVDCENYCYSFGQWLYCYEQTREEYNYYIFQEDDYVPNVDNFDTIYIDAYKKQFPEDIGVMCGMLLGTPTRLSHLALHVSAPIVVSSKTLKMLYDSKIWNGNPRSAMQNIQEYQNLFTPKEAKCFRKFKQGIGAYYQLGFSLLFNKLDIPSSDILEQSEENVFLYWDDKSKKVYLYSSKQKVIPLNIKTYESLKPRAYFLPFQWEN
jgi:hypothetical protein